MKKVELLKNEKVIFKVKFSSRVILMDILFIFLVFTINNYFIRNNLDYLSLFSFTLFVPLVIKLFLDFYRVLFHKVYISNMRVFYQKLFHFKPLRVFQLNDIVAVYFKSSIMDFNKNMTSFKCVLSNNTFFVLKNVAHGKKVAELLSEDLNKRNKQK